MSGTPSAAGISVGVCAVTRIDGLRRTVSNLARAIDFYCGALGFRAGRVDNAAGPPVARLHLGEQHLDLVAQGDALHVPAAALAPDPRFQHAAIVTDDMAEAWRRVESHAAAAIGRGGPQRLPARAGGVTAVKFRDPDGHPLELIEFPAGVGVPRWQGARSDGPTLGIDHFALVVADVERSAAFFADELGFGVASRGVNRGIEQDRLDGLDGVVVDVVSLGPRASSRAPHLELLCYRRPAFGAMPVGESAVAERDGRDEIVCVGAPHRPDAGLGLRLRDPDGHRFVVCRTKRASPADATARRS